MAKAKMKAKVPRRTIVDNPLDSVISDPSAGLLQPRNKPVKTQAVERKSAHPPAPDSFLERIECLEQENQCMKWLVGAVLAPLALLALLL